MPAHPAVGDVGTDGVSPPNDWASKQVAFLGVTLDMATGSFNLPLATGTGDALSYANTTTAQRVAIKKGTAGTPDTSLNPLLKVERTVQADHTGFSGDGAEAMAGILSIVKGTASNDGQVVGVYGLGTSASTTAASAGGDDACGVYGLGRITGSGTGTGLNFLGGRRETNTGKANAIEVSIDNATATADSYSSSGFSNTTGLWVHATGTSRSGVGLSIGNPFNVQLDVGIGITSQGTGGPVLSQSFRDDSQAATSIQINGTHATAAIAVAASSGQILLGGTSSVFAITNNVLEVQGSNNNIDGLVAVGSVANQKDYTIRVRNSSGQVRWGIVGGAGDFLTGTAVGDAIIGTTTSAKALHIGGTTKVITVTTANELGVFATSPITQYNTTGTATGFTAGAGTTATHLSTFTGNTGSTAYTTGDVVRALKLYGFLAA